jgi:hypothetical protein
VEFYQLLEWFYIMSLEHFYRHHLGKRKFLSCDLLLGGSSEKPFGVNDKSLSEERVNIQTNKLLLLRSIHVSHLRTVGVVAFNGSNAHTNQQINAIVPINGSLCYWALLMAKSLKSLLGGMGRGATVTFLQLNQYCDHLLPRPIHGKVVV